MNLMEEEIIKEARRQITQKVKVGKKFMIAR
jgi:hypothetical protein